MMTVLALALAALTAAGLVHAGRIGDPDRTRRCKCEGCRTGLPDDGDPLEDWEQEWIRWIEACYRATAHDPMTRSKNAARRSK